MITAPFNFVPLSDKVFFPQWAEDVSHDIPFEDGESGLIDITITAKSPIFIRDHENPEKFCQHNREYYIPSTSIKGMVRNVLEIMSFSKMYQVDDDTYAVRDLSSSKNFYMTQMQKDVYCGWLKKIDGEYFIEDCGIAHRIRHEEIDKATGKNFASNFKQVGFEKTSKYKYDILGQTHQSITVGESYKSTTNAKYDKRLFCRYDKDGKKGTLVLTGQPTPRKDTGKMGDGKGFEFVFFESKKDLKLSKEKYENFLFAYFDKRTTEPKESPDWTFWKEKLQNGKKVPVFFQKENGNIAHFGLSFLYKLPYKYSVKDGIPDTHKDTKKDLSQTLFGYTDKKDALKGRVQFSHFKAENAKELALRTEVLGTPRASYYPMYVRQDPKLLFTTFMDANFKIAGWKRYPIHRGSSVKKTIETENEKIGTSFCPLKEGALFRGKVHYHNLKKAELGALLSVLTFHNTPKTYHNIGMAKSLGYGKISIELNGVQDIESYLKAFEAQISLDIENWIETKQLKELLTMATEQNNSGNSKLQYMELKQFSDSKSKNKDYLRPYTELNNITIVKPTTFIDTQTLESLKQEHQEAIKRQEKLLEKKQMQEKFHNELSEVQKSDNIQIIENFIQKYPDAKEVEELKSKLYDLKNNQKEQKFDAVNKKAQAAWEAVVAKKSNQKQYKKLIEKFITKWSKEKENKKSEYILNLVEQARMTL